MPQLRDFLSRFGPAGAPGAARAAVPADRHRQLVAELDPVLMLLDGQDAECVRYGPAGTDSPRRRLEDILDRPALDPGSSAQVSPIMPGEDHDPGNGRLGLG